MSAATDAMPWADMDPAIFYLVIVPLVFLALASAGEWLLDRYFDRTDK